MADIHTPPKDNIPAVSHNIHNPVLLVQYFPGMDSFVDTIRMIRIVRCARNLSVLMGYQADAYILSHSFLFS